MEMTAHIGDKRSYRRRAVIRKKNGGNVRAIVQCRCVMQLMLAVLVFQLLDVLLALTTAHIRPFLMQRLLLMFR